MVSNIKVLKDNSNNIEVKEENIAMFPLKIKCSECGETTKADQCDNCGYTPSVEELKDGVCLVCGSKAVEKDNKNLYFALSKFQDIIQANTDKCKQFWRVNARNETEK